MNYSSKCHVSAKRRAHTAECDIGIPANVILKSKRNEELMRCPCALVLAAGKRQNIQTWCRCYSSAAAASQPAQAKKA
eukprot:4554832-Pleurochrysis_carterae.AAC.2